MHVRALLTEGAPARPPLPQVDAQGHDYRVLRGATGLLSARRVRNLVIEFCPSLMPGGEAEALDALRLMARLGPLACMPCFDATSPSPREVPAGGLRGAEFARRFARTGPHTGKGYDNIVCNASLGWAR